MEKLNIILRSDNKELFDGIVEDQLMDELSFEDRKWRRAIIEIGEDYPSEIQGTWETNTFTWDGYYNTVIDGPTELHRVEVTETRREIIDRSFSRVDPEKRLAPDKR